MQTRSGYSGNLDADNAKITDLQNTNRSLMQKINELTSRAFFVSTDMRAASGRRLADLEEDNKRKDAALATYFISVISVDSEV